MFKINNFSPFFYKKNPLDLNLFASIRKKKINEYQRKYNESHLHCLTFLFFKKKNPAMIKKKILKNIENSTPKFAKIDYLNSFSRVFSEKKKKKNNHINTVFSTLQALTTYSINKNENHHTFVMIL